MNILEKQIADAQVDIIAAAESPEVARTVPPSLSASAPAAPPPLPGAVAFSGRSWVHLVTFGLLLLGGALSLWEGLAHRPLLMSCAFAAIILNLGWGVAALVQQKRRRLPARLIPIAWIDVAGHALGVPTVFMGFSIPYSIQAAKISQATGHGTPPAQMGLTALRAMPGFHYVLLVYGAICLLLGAVGFALMLRRSSHRSPPPVP